MKFAIDIGHNCLNDSGAVGLRKEDDLTMEVGVKLMQLLEAAGHRTLSCLPKVATSVSDSLRQRVEKANTHHANVFVSIHFNAFNGKAYGSEVYALSRAGKGIGREVLDEICQLGYFNRGVKSANFYVLRYTRMPAILIEACFCDHKGDMAFYDGARLAKAICKGLIGEVPELYEKTPGKMLVTQNTYLKPSTEQSIDLPAQELVALAPGEYSLLDYSPEEESHYCVELKDFTDKHYIYSRHCQIIPTGY